jgi:heme exporter protein D
MAEFFAMGGYAPFVWSSYAASALVLGVAVVLSLSAHQRARRTLKRLEDEVGETGEKGV